MAAEVPPNVYCADIGKQIPCVASSFRIADESVEEATCRVFKVGDISILVDLKDLCRRFGLEWSFVTRRSGKTIACNRSSRTCSFVNSGKRNYTSITYGCDWLVRFRGVDCKKCTSSDPVVITKVCGSHSNTCNPAVLDQFVLSRTRAGIYKKCNDHSLQEVMLQMAIEPFVSVRAMRGLLSKVLPDRVFIDRHMINNVRIRARHRKRELERSNIVIHPKHFDTSFIETYKDTSDNYTEGMYMFV